MIVEFGFEVPQLNAEACDRIVIGHLRKQAGHNVNLFSDVAVIGRSRGRSHTFSPHFQKSGGRDAPILLAMYLSVHETISGLLLWFYLTLFAGHCQGIYGKFPEFSQSFYRPKFDHMVYFLSFYERLILHFCTLPQYHNHALLTCTHRDVLTSDKVHKKIMCSLTILSLDFCPARMYTILVNNKQSPPARRDLTVS